MSKIWTINKIFQLKITLKDSKPRIWRSFQIEDSMTFYDLHNVIQIVMGWSDSHLYQFIYGNNSYIGNPEMLQENDFSDERKTKLSDIFGKPKTKIQYEYDFGDGWDHELVLEKIVERNPSQFYPFCMEGEMNCPPEDCGGIYGYYDMLKKLKSKKHPEHDEIAEWMGDNSDPDFFDLHGVNKILKNFRDTEFE